jgi:hypothetical protein
MLRLAHRIMLGPIYGWEDSEKFDDEDSKKIAGMASVGPVILADNIAQYFYSRGESTGKHDLPSMIPPFEKCFIEWNIPEHGNRYRPTGVLQMGVHVKVNDVTYRADGSTQYRIDQDPEDAPGKWIVAEVFSSMRPGAAVVYRGRFCYLVSLEGKYLGDFCGQSEKNIDFACFPAFFAIGFMHCKNVRQSDATEESGPPQKWLRRMQQPELKYKVLVIDPMRGGGGSSVEPGDDADGQRMPLHIVRGHFAKYSPERPLFGRYSGTFWVPSHVRGKSDFGTVIKDYAVKSPR